MRRSGAYLTVYLALCLTLLLSLYLVMIDGARRNGARLEAVCATEAGLQSIMAEYHRELLEQYNLFAIDSTYGSSAAGRRNTEEHLRQYIERNLSFEDILLSDYLYRDFFGLKLENAELSGASFLTDGGGALFRQRAVEAVKDDIGLHLLEEIREWLRVIEVNGLDRSELEAAKRQVDGQIEEYNGLEVSISEDESVCVEIENPTDALEAKRRLGILRLALEEPDNVSGNRVNGEVLVKSRMEKGIVNRGNLETAEADDLVSRFLFQEYLFRYMGYFGEEDPETALRYQIEYLIAGNDSDADNLRSVANRICAIREAANALFLFADQEKRAEIEAAAIVVCGIFALPVLIPLVEFAILMGWAYAESIYDVKSLLAGGRIPLIKDSSGWHYSLEAALSGELQDVTEGGDGLSYQDYLRVLMLLTDLETLTQRAMNMVEADIRRTEGNASFRLDACMDRLEAAVCIKSSFGYEFQIQRKRSYEGR
ncbi:MAG: DUF5702 domain-containing protein [Roseburia sp.]|nr:DUF5702 domain-containing protein [Roseburia sp.]MCM1099222.1 DUF5702 domain-containing protein [Ruminococcus flavefaciens]